jgi:uncharacterized protein YuzE
MELEYDGRANCAYLYLTEKRSGAVKVTSIAYDKQGLFRQILFDWDPEGHLVGIEFLGADGLLPAELLNNTKT